MSQNNSEPGQQIVHVTRVMSPTQPMTLEHIQAMCQLCSQHVFESGLCAMCGRYWHPVCLQLEVFLDVTFCRQCIPTVLSEYASFQDAKRRDAWRRSLSAQVSDWKSRAVEAIGVSSTIGVAVGGAVAAVAGAAAGLAHGAVRGAVATASLPTLPANTPRQMLPDAPGQPSDNPGSRGGLPSDSSGGRVGTPGEANTDAAPAAPADSAAPPAAAVQLSQPMDSVSNFSLPPAATDNSHCLLCWKPKLGLARPLAHIHKGDCREQKPAVPVARTVPRSDIDQARMQPVPRSPGSLFDSAASGYTALPFDSTVCREGLPSDDPCGRAVPPVQPPQPQTTQQPQPVAAPQPLQDQPQGLSAEERIKTLEDQLAAVTQELLTTRREMENLLGAVQMASEESQNVAMRMDHIEHEWLLWNECQPADAADQAQPLVAAEGAMVPSQQPPEEHRLTPVRAPRDDLLDLFGDEGPDSLQQWWDATPLQPSQPIQDLPRPLTPPGARAPPAVRQQPITGGGTLANTPPGLGLTMATATGNLAGRRPEGPTCAPCQPYGGGGPGGDASVTLATNSGMALPGITTAPQPSLTTPLFGARQVEQQQGDSDIYSFHAGTRPSMPAHPGHVPHGPTGSGGVDMVAPTMPQPSAQCRGAAPVSAP